MKFIPAFLLATSIAYYYCASLPQPVTKNIKNRMTERLIMILFGTIILGFVALSHLAISTWYTPYLWMGLGIFYVLGSIRSYLGYNKWNVLWQDKPSNAAQMIAQMVMWAWNFTIALCAFIML